MNDDALSYYLKQLHSTKSEDAYFTLLTDIAETDIPKLIAAFHSESVPHVQVTLLEIIWQQRVPDTLNFLANVLQNPVSKLWQTALDGIVAIDTPVAMNILQAERKRLLSSQLHDASSRLEYINEAIEQLSEM